MALFNLFRDLGALSIGAGLIYFIARHLIKNYFQKELEAYRSQLEQERIKFSELHGTRADVIAELYEKLVEAEESMEALASPIQFQGNSGKEDSMKDAHQAMRGFFRYYNRKKIYLPPEVEDDIGKLLDEYQSIFADFSILRIHENDRFMESDKVSENMDKWLEDWESIKNGEVNDIKEDLEDNFRELLGVRLEDD